MPVEYRNNYLESPILRAVLTSPSPKGDETSIADDDAEVGRFTRTVHACLVIVTDDGGATGSRFNVIEAHSTSAIFNCLICLKMSSAQVYLPRCVTREVYFKWSHSLRRFR